MIPASVVIFVKTSLAVVGFISAVQAAKKDNWLNKEEILWLIILFALIFIEAFPR